MRLVAVELTNWKGYRRARVRLPVDPERSVVIIEGNNGAGKTSLLEALAFGLFGRAALPLVARASSTGRQTEAYDTFLERALSLEARSGPARMSVVLRFERGERHVGVERVWHFSASGRLRKADEEVRLYEGPDAELVMLPVAEVDRAEAVREWINEELISENLASFFLLDGEHLERMSGATAEALIRDAVDTALGAAELRSLASDLRSYARERRRLLSPAVSSGESAQQLIATLENEEAIASNLLSSTLAQLAPLRSERDDVVRRIGSLHGESYRTFKALFEQREATVRERDRERDELRRLLVGDLALALAGSPLRTRTLNRIEAEGQASAVRRGQEASVARLDEFLDELRSQDNNLVTQHRLEITSAWHKVWSNDQPGAAAGRYGHLGDEDRQAVASLLKHLEDVDAASFAALARSVSEKDREILTIEREVARQRGLEGDAQALADDLSRVQSQISSLEEQHASQVTALEALRGRLQDARQARDQQIALASEAAPIVRRSAKADALASIAEQCAIDSLPAALADLSVRITEAYVAMAHKSVVQSINVRANGRVELLDARGRDLRAVDASAGESQILALAVMSALASLAPDFPLVIDTPLARLDPLHRMNVLRHFASAGRQLILLTHPAELGPNEAAMINDHVGATIGLSQSPSPTLLAASA